VTVFGHNFFNESGVTWSCLFGYSQVPARVMISDASNARIVCDPAPVGPSNQQVWFEILRNGVQILNPNNANFFYNALCPNSACNNGVCSLGQCVCNYGWMGIACDYSKIVHLKRMSYILFRTCCTNYSNSR
jgi:hypothetical protein